VLNELTIIFNVFSATFALPDGLLSSLCYVESKGNARAISRNDGGSDSIGVCQIKLNTAKLEGYKGTEEGLLNPATNAYFAAKYLARQIKRYKGNYAKAITAYNQGSTKSHGGSLYLTKVFNRWVECGQRYQSETKATPYISSGRSDRVRAGYPRETVCF
jgi:hypothetical protein